MAAAAAAVRTMVAVNCNNSLKGEECVGASEILPTIICDSYVLCYI